MPLKEPLDPLVEIDLRAVMKLVMDHRGNPWDTALSFMILRCDNAIRFGKLTEEDTHMGNLIRTSWAIRDRTSMWDQHMSGIKRLGEMMAAAKAKGES